LGIFNNKKFRFYSFVCGFSATYLYSLHLAKKCDNEILRIGAAGSVTVLMGESCFYFIDAVNTRSKIIMNENVGLIEMTKRILKSEGIYGMYKGYSSCFYSSILYGYVYFFFYKGLKVHFKEKFQPITTSAHALIYAMASAMAEFVALLIYYPFELIKIRFLTKNDVYLYESVSDAFLKIMRKDKIKGLYKGIVPFFFTYLG
jgi:hypothetical protein